MMARSTYLDSVIIFGFGTCTVYEVFHRTVDAVGEVLTLDGIPTDAGELEKLAVGFKNSRSPPNPLSGCIGAIDGLAVMIKKPNDDLNPSQFYCRKQFYSLPLQAVVDSDYHFIYSSLRCVGSTHDSLAFPVSGLTQYLRSVGLKEGLRIAADEAYECTNNMITPIPKRRAPLGSREGSFNFYHSSLRMRKYKHLVYLQLDGDPLEAIVLRSASICEGG